MVVKRILAAMDLGSVQILGRVGYDPMHPWTGLGSVKGSMIEGLEDLNPTGLKDILGQAVVAGDPPGEREKAAAAASNLGFGVAFKKRTVFGGLLELRGGQHVKTARHQVLPCFPLRLAGFRADRFRLEHSGRSAPPAGQRSDPAAFGAKILQFSMPNSLQFSMPIDNYHAARLSDTPCASSASPAWHGKSGS